MKTPQGTSHAIEVGANATSKGRVLDDAGYGNEEHMLASAEPDAEAERNASTSLLRPLRSTEYSGLASGAMGELSKVPLELIPLHPNGKMSNRLVTFQPSPKSSRETKFN